LTVKGVLLFIHGIDICDQRIIKLSTLYIHDQSGLQTVGAHMASLSAIKNVFEHFCERMASPMVPRLTRIRVKTTSLTEAQYCGMLPLTKTGI